MKPKPGPIHKYCWNVSNTNHESVDGPRDRKVLLSMNEPANAGRRTRKHLPIGMKAVAIMAERGLARHHGHERFEAHVCVMDW